MKNNIGIFLLVWLSIGSQAALWAGCDKTYTQKLRFLLPYAKTNFASAGMEKFCPKSFILNDNTAGEGLKNWVARFDFSQTGNEVTVATGVRDAVTKALKNKGFSAKPSFTESNSRGQYELRWTGPSDTVVLVQWYPRDDKQTSTTFEIRVMHFTEK